MFSFIKTVSVPAMAAKLIGIKKIRSEFNIKN